MHHLSAELLEEEVVMKDLVPVAVAHHRAVAARQGGVGEQQALLGVHVWDQDLQKVHPSCRGEAKENSSDVLEGSAHDRASSFAAEDGRRKGFPWPGSGTLDLEQEHREGDQGSILYTT